jgi:hypothetical protein
VRASKKPPLLAGVMNTGRMRGAIRRGDAV